MRIFWEKADYDDSDTNSAFRKRQKEKMKLRKKTKYEIESYFKMFELRADSVNVLLILQAVHKREDLKKRANLADQAIFEALLDNALKERGQTTTTNVNTGVLNSSSTTSSAMHRNNKIDTKKLEYNPNSGL